MYEDEVPVFRRILWIALWFIVVVAVLWTLAWLIFFRHDTSKVSTSNKSGSQHQSTKQPASPPSKTGSSSGSSSTSNGSSNAPSGAAPNTLANTGAGDVVVPFLLAGVTGGALYYVRLRRKLLP